MKIDITSKIGKEFYQRDTETVAKELLGKILVRNYNGITLSGKIVETEAYLPKNDPACHAANNRTNRNEAMFLEGGYVYVYKIYGIHHCFNIVTGNKDEGCAVLIRAVEPISGIEQMKELRGKNNIKELCSGPGKITQAFRLSKNENMLSLLGNDIFCLYNSDKINNIVEAERVGISKGKELKLRYYIKDSEFVSVK